MAAVATGIIAMRRAKWMDTHDCNAYCRGERHADVFLVPANHPEPMAVIAKPIEALGWRVAYMEPARESNDQPDDSFIDEHGRIIDRKITGEWTPWLVVWAEGAA